MAGHEGIATAGYEGVAVAGHEGVVVSRGVVSVGRNGCGLVRGRGVKARGGIGSILVICIEDENGHDVKEWKPVFVDGERVKANTLYTLKDGELVEVEE